MIELNKTYIHYKNKKSYITINFCKIQENDTWVKAVIYKPDDCDELFVRTYEEFQEKFLLK
ncbi:DUF1653 domain-containing protein [Aliarcobacter cryaerophilus]|uniref:DUF1653 domain-containing protein n=1 Tax=Aliarcobacter cryaerophilus TaxID=28198 RepID=A0A1V9V8V3_9BACT|nr:DUF1653 domain-containing protein [Aliarcobacter cryaerophilus]